MTRSYGFTAIESVVIVGVLIVIGIVGYIAYARLSAPQPEVPSIGKGTAPAAIESPRDLDTAGNELDTMKLDDNDSSQLDEMTDGL